ncbi:MAG: histidinol dehydrogenase [Candidatus Thermoplasmatota archaeon]|nr:histidinol dehydrogenase [Candidatus Thermoplasmatota archaeon]MDA8143305.1 histidinol dehydrogenase [Thermoplasmatales archaeon]
MDIEKYTREVLDDIKQRGEEALKEYSARFDHYVGPIRAPAEEIEKSDSLLKPGQISAIDTVIERVRQVHSAQINHSTLFTQNGSLYGIMERPLRRVGLYVPGGKPLPSSLIMSAVPARIAGVREIVVVTAPKDGKIDPAILYIAKKLGIDEIYRLGGIQAVGAMAYGIGMKPVQKIFGPGNAFVTEAKRQVFGTVGIDGLNGPSEICIVADETADPEYVTADLASQLEHGPDSKAWLLTTSPELAQVCESQGVDIKIYSSLEECFSRANELAPEHLELLVREPMRFIDMIENAGAVYLGQYTPVPAGDYFLGVNHVLPTGGSAVFSSALTVWDFTKRISMAYTGKDEFMRYREAGMELATIEGMTAHRKSMETRK